MKTLIVTNRKGGTGKTTLAWEMAVELSKKLKTRTMVLDLDPIQGSISKWKARSEDNYKDVFVAKALPKEVTEAIEVAKRNGVGVVLVDAMPTLDVAGLGVMQQMDAVLLPMAPSHIELEGSLTTIYAAQALRKPLMIVPTSVNGNTREGHELRLALDGEALPVSKSELRDRVSYRRACQQGRHAGHFDRKAGMEIKNLASEVCELLEVQA